MEIIGYTLAGCFLVLYLVWVYQLAVALDQPPVFLSDTIVDISVSIVVAMRNEQQNIVNLLDAIYAQQNSPLQKELILVDDHSTDQTLLTIENWRQSHPGFTIRIIAMSDLHDSGKGKKAALYRGISSSQYDYIITTDADCTMSTKWLHTMCKHFMMSKPALLAGPVILNADSLFGKLQQVEMLLLQALTCGTFTLKMPVMCNAANMMFCKRDYLSLSDASLQMQVASGDDLFFMLSLKQKKMRLNYAVHSDCIVRTCAQNNFLEFMNQRIRWASKMKIVTDKHILMTGGMVMVMNLLMLYFFAIAVGGLTPWYSFLIWFALKFLCDVILLYKYLQKMELKFAWFPVLILFEVVFPFYNILIATFATVGRYKWKGRRY